MHRLAFLLALFATAALADNIEGKVVAIADGDTLTVLDSAKQQHKVRIAGIDAPEKRQAYGERSRQNLASLAFQKPATLDCYKVDRYRRQACRVWVDRQDVGLAQVSAGRAWHYKDYQREQTPEERTAYPRAENDARLSRVGLWGDPKPVPPWGWRQLST